MNTKKFIGGLKIGAFIATLGLTVLSKYIETQEQKQAIDDAVQKYLSKKELQ